MRHARALGVRAGACVRTVKTTAAEHRGESVRIRRRVVIISVFFGIYFGAIIRVTHFPV